jgi:dTDP-4-amino-4,6-dideoxygalactose transaminase
MKEYRIYLSPPHLDGSETELLLEAMRSNWIAPLGPQVDAFEREFANKLGMPCAVALSSGTASLHLALIVAGVKAGDEVWTSSLTFAATANAISYVGASPVFLDSDTRTWNMDPEILEEELKAAAGRGHLPKAVLVVDIYGQCADHERIAALCQRYEVPLIEDAAEALGATYHDRPAGTFGQIGCFSFNGNKIITTSGGGMLVCRDPAVAHRVRYLACQAMDSSVSYEHSEIGYNYRMSNLLAAVGRGQLRVLDRRIEQRRKIFEYYRSVLGDLPGVEFMPEPPGHHSTRWLTCLVIDPSAAGVNRDCVRTALEEAHIQARPVWKPMHLQAAFRHCRVYGGGISARLHYQGLCLPSGSSLTEAELAEVAGLVRSTTERAQVSSR